MVSLFNFICLSLAIILAATVNAYVDEGDGFYEGYPLGGNEAYSWGRGYPQSCVCAETNVAAALCDQFKVPISF